MSASRRAVTKLRAFIRAAIELGWSRDSIPALVDLWWKHHDEETGELK